MKIGLIDVDSHNFPNLALMKISAYEKSKGNSVEWWNGFEHYDRVYKAKVFDQTYTDDLDYVIDADEVIEGGTGYNLNSVLPDEIEHIYPDYGLYGIHHMAIGFLTRGCPRHCAFCIVGDKEGLVSHKVADLSEFWNGQENIELMDANLLACKDRAELLEQLAESRAIVNFNQGLDVRLLNQSVAEVLNHIRIKRIHFAWDNYEFNTLKCLEDARQWLRFNGRDIVVYVLTNFNTTIEQDLERIYKIKDVGFDPYVMIYDKPNAPNEIRRLQRWCNSKQIFRSCDWADYK